MKNLYLVTFINQEFRDVYVVAEGFDDAKHWAKRQICSVYDNCPIISNIALLASEVGSPSPDLANRPPALFIKL